MGPAHVVGRATYRTLEQVADAFLQDAVRRKPDRVLDAFRFQYNLGNFLRTLATAEPIKDWSMTTLREKLIKIGAKVVGHARYVSFQMAEVLYRATSSPTSCA